MIGPHRLAVRRMVGLPQEDPAGGARLLVDQGFDSVVLHADTPPECARVAADVGLRVWVYSAAFSLGRFTERDAEPLLARDVDGTPRTWFRSGCPNRRELRDAHIASIERLASLGVFTGFLLDGIRFASPNAREGYFTCFCDVCRVKAETLGYDYASMRAGTAALRDRCRASSDAPLAQVAADLPAALGLWPGVADWLRFRAACVVEHVGEVREAIAAWRGSGGAPFLLGAYVFTPAFAPLVGQRYGDIAPLLDQVSPMIYRRDGGGDSGLTTEHAALAELRLLPPKEDVSEGDVGAEVALARALLPNSRLIPILRLADERVAETTRAARAAGVDGLDYFRYQERGRDDGFVRGAGAAAAMPIAAAGP